MASAARRPTIVWLLLVVGSATSFLSGGVMSASGWGFLAVMGIAAFKAVLIVRDYMDIRHAPPVWKLLFAGLIAVATLLIAGLHLAVGLA